MAFKKISYIIQSSLVGIYIVTLALLNVTVYHIFLYISEIRIEGVPNSKIFEGDRSSETLYWKSSDGLLKSGRPPFLNYTFISNPIDNKKYYTCEANRSDDKNPLVSRVQLVVLRKFVYFFFFLICYDIKKAVTFFFF